MKTGEKNERKRNCFIKGFWHNYLKQTSIKIKLLNMSKSCLKELSDAELVFLSSP